MGRTRGRAGEREGVIRDGLVIMRAPTSRRSLLLLLLLAFIVSAFLFVETVAQNDDDHDDDHEEHGPPCFCEAAEQGWTIDCASPANVTTALNYLLKEENGYEKK